MNWHLRVEVRVLQHVFLRYFVALPVSSMSKAVVLSPPHGHRPVAAGDAHIVNPEGVLDAGDQAGEGATVLQRVRFAN